MGADLIIAVLPSCDLFEERKKILHDIVNDSIDADCLASADLYDYEDDIDEVKQALHDAIDEYKDALSRRDVDEMEFEGALYRYLITGGMSWGDEPTDAMSFFGILDQCTPLYNLLRQWAIDDKKGR